LSLSFFFLTSLDLLQNSKTKIKTLRLFYLANVFRTFHLQQITNELFTQVLMSQLTPRPKRKASVSMSPLANTTKYQRSTTPVKIDPTKLRNLEPELSRINHDRLEEFCKLLCSAASGDTNIALVQALIDNSYLDKNLMITDEEENVKTHLITAYWESEKTSNGMNQPVETPPIDLGSQQSLKKP
jgi:hypothetical protein